MEALERQGQEDPWNSLHSQPSPQVPVRDVVSKNEIDSSWEMALELAFSLYTHMHTYPHMSLFRSEHTHFPPKIHFDVPVNMQTEASKFLKCMET